MYLAFIGIALSELLYIFFMGLFGLTFFYQQIFSLLYTMIFLTVCINFDDEIMSLAETSGFISQTSRSQKFYIFFVAVIMYVFMVLINAGMGDAWQGDISFVENVINVSCGLWRVIERSFI